MGDTTGEKIIDTAETINAVANAVPIYRDLIQPGAKELGKSIYTITKTINVALAPCSMLVWGYEKIKDFISNAIAKRLENIPSENIITPDTTVAGPALEALRFVGHKEDLRELYANLLATAMNKETAFNAHPAFVEILKQITSDEAKIMRLMSETISFPIIVVRAYDELDHYSEPIRDFSLLPEQANCAVPELGPTYLENIERFGLAKISYTSYSTLYSYEPLENHVKVVKTKDFIVSSGKRPEIMRGTICRTSFGETFYNACIKNQAT